MLYNGHMFTLPWLHFRSIASPTVAHVVLRSSKIPHRGSMCNPSLTPHSSLEKDISLNHSCVGMSCLECTQLRTKNVVLQPSTAISSTDFRSTDCRRSNCVSRPTWQWRNALVAASLRRRSNARVSTTRARLVPAYFWSRRRLTVTVPFARPTQTTMSAVQVRQIDIYLACITLL